MIEKLLSWLKERKEVITYLIFGVLTTLVNYAVYLPLYNWAHLSATLSNAIAWIAAVAFAFLTNKPFVFGSHDWHAKVVLPELIKFVGCRVGSGMAETAIIFAAVDTLHWNGNIWKILTSILVVILNFIASKLLVFNKKEEP